MSPHDSSPAHTLSPTEANGFAALGVPTVLATSLAERGITTPFPIQAATLPDSLAGRDVLGRGRTGSGKTVAFALPLLSVLQNSGTRRQPGRPRALVLVPTRELATQLLETIDPLARTIGLKAMTIFGGVPQGRQVSGLKSGVDVIVATPGRLEDLIDQRHCSLAAVEVTVIDEADHMADLGFLPPVKRLLDQTPRGTQRLLFSATLDKGIDVLVKRYLNNPVTHSVDTAASPVPDMQHHSFVVPATEKATVVRELVAGQGRTLAFTRTKHGAKKLAKQLTASGIPAADMHGNLSQNARQRNLAAFGDGSVRVLIATDIAARGIHVDDVSLVVHVDPPAEHKAYLHRSGRTARAGAEGVVVTVSTPEQRNDVRDLMRKAGIKPTRVEVVPGHPAITELTGPAAEYVAPAAPPAAGSGPGGQTRGNGGGGSRSGRGRSRSGGGRGRSQTGPDRNGRPGENAGARSGGRSTGGGRRRSGRQGASAGTGRSGGAAGFSAKQR
ncbi:MAG: DEAD/DEAH box helicase [Propionibacteriaceae bacterium]